jgi:hypothetical protein
MGSGKSMVNYPIDTPLFTVSLEERPMIYQVIKNKEYYQLHHKGKTISKAGMELTVEV